MPRVHLCLLLLPLVLVGPAQAQPATTARPNNEARVPNFLGTTGLLLIPSAYVQRDRQFSAQGGRHRPFQRG